MEKSTNKKKRSQTDNDVQNSAAISGGKLLQSLTVLTKNDHFPKSLVADGIAYEWF
jgi:hypothetical protein